MKKLFILILSILTIGTLVSCKKEEDINTPKEFKTGDIVTSNGVIYQYIDVCKDIETLEGEEAKEYIFEEEENYRAYYNYYYLDMSNYKNQPKLREDKSIGDISIESIYEFDRSNNPNLSPITPYAFYLPSYLDIAGIKTIPLNGSFIVKGYTEDLPENVIIPEKIHGKYVSQIGYRAFENAPMKTLSANTVNYVHPYAISQCNHLKEINLNGSSLMSMSICNSKNIEKITGIRVSMDCCLYNLPKLAKLEDTCPLYYLEESWGYYHNCYGLGGIRKSFFYNCPRLESITGKDYYTSREIQTVANTVYLDYGNEYAFPIYVYKNYTAVIDDVVFTDAGRWDYTILYNPNTLEAYIPFLNDGLEKEGTILFRHHEQGPESVMEDETGIYINATYYDSKYNAKLLFKRK